MKANVEIPKAFSVRDEHEFYPIQHLMARLNPELMVVQAATGRHVNGGGTVLWGIVCLKNKPPTKQDVENALKDAGLDCSDHAVIRTPDLWAGKASTVNV